MYSEENHPNFIQSGSDVGSPNPIAAWLSEVQNRRIIEPAQAHQSQSQVTSIAPQLLHYSPHWGQTSSTRLLTSGNNSTDERPDRHGVRLPLPQIVVKNAKLDFTPQGIIKFYSHGRLGFSLIDAINERFDALEHASCPAFEPRIAQQLRFNIKWSEANADDFTLGFDFRPKLKPGSKVPEKPPPLSRVAKAVARLVWKKFKATQYTDDDDKDMFIMFDNKRMFFKDLYVLGLRHASISTFCPVLSWKE
ncbi:hypothetical protein BDW22DRAFT_802473 [Trametopsis cervina]|nr:hypothetical protein BDW22DRAFT_802473 [Trametopsis cervina]